MAVAKTARSKAKSKKMGRSRKEPDLSTYSSRMAARFRELRVEKYDTLDEFKTVLSQHGLDVPLQTLYKYEQGRTNINPDYYPYIASALGKSVRAFLPAE